MGAYLGVRFNEGLAGEAIVCRLESRDQRVRANVRFPEEEQHAFSVEATFEIGDQLLCDRTHRDQAVRESHENGG